jgi:hypothetical protein
MSDEEVNYARMEAMRRLGVRFVSCSQCSSTMREPPDPFQGPHVIWGAPIEGIAPVERSRGDAGDTLYYVCSSGCHDKIQAKLRVAERRTSTLKRDRLRAAGKRS